MWNKIYMCDFLEPQLLKLYLNAPVQYPESSDLIGVRTILNSKYLES